MIPEPERRPATSYGLRADELGQQMLMGGVAAASIALIIVLLIFAGFVIAGLAVDGRSARDRGAAAAL